MALTSQHTFANGFGYSFNANYAKNTNEVKELGPGNAPIISSGSVAHAYYITEVGKPIGNYYLLVQDGIFATEEDLKKYPHFDNTEVGDFRFVDVDGDGKLDLDKDRTTAATTCLSSHTASAVSSGMQVSTWTSTSRVYMATRF